MNQSKFQQYIQNRCILYSDKSVIYLDGLSCIIKFLFDEKIIKDAFPKKYIKEFEALEYLLFTEVYQLVDVIKNNIHFPTIAFTLCRALLERWLSIKILLEDKHKYVIRLQDFILHWEAVHSYNLINNADFRKKNKWAYRNIRTQFKPKEKKDLNNSEYYWFYTIEKYNNKSLTNLVNDYCGEQLQLVEEKKFNHIPYAFLSWFAHGSSFNKAFIDDQEYRWGLLTTVFTIVNNMLLYIEESFQLKSQELGINEYLLQIDLYLKALKQEMESNFPKNQIIL